MAAQFQVGQILQGQEKFDEAIAAFKGYLAKFPNGPQSADAQRAVLDSQLLIADDLQRREKYAEARAAFARVRRRRTRSTAACPQVLFEVGQTSYRREEARRGDRRLGDAGRQVPRHRARRPRPVPRRLDLREREGGPDRGDRALPQGGGRALASRRPASGSP